MTVDEILALGLHDDNTVIEIAGIDPFGEYFLKRGHWYFDKILEYSDAPISRFEWQEGMALRITLKEVKT